MDLSSIFQNGLFALTILCSYPLSYLIRRFVAPSYRAYFHILFGFMICLYLYSFNFLIVLGYLVLAYFMLLLKGKLLFLGLLIPMIALGVIHSYRYMHIGQWKSDISGLIMFTSLRLWTLIFNIYDGRQKEVKRKNWKNVVVEKQPNFITYIAYLFSYSALYSGPLIPFNAFLELLEMEHDRNNEDLKFGLISWLQSLGFCIIYGIGVKLIPVEFIVSKKFIEMPYLLRLLISILECFLHISRYIFAWLGGESGFRALGISHVKSIDFDDCRSIKLSIYFNLGSISDLSREWNHTIHYMLKEYIHVRIIACGFSNIFARTLTFLFSAYWHGFLPGYYILAFLEMFVGYFDNYRIKNFNPLLEKYIGERALKCFSIIWTHSMNFFMGAPFDLYWGSKFLEFYQIMKFGPFIALLVMDIIGFIYKIMKPKEIKPKKE